VPVEDDRARAFVLAHIPGRQAEAVQLFEATLVKGPLTPDERFLLAQVYDANKDDFKAGRELRALLVLYPDQPRYIACYIQSLLNRGDLDAVPSYLSMLEQLEPNSPRTRQLRATYQKLQAVD
jgi:hypothetical protein